MPYLYTNNKRPGWNSGPPPSIGWWPASLRCDPRMLRWWDGKTWSVAFNSSKYQSPQELDVYARVKYSGAVGKVYWTDRPKSWPKRSKT